MPLPTGRHHHPGVLRFPYERDYVLEASNDDTWDLKLNNQWDLENGFKLQLPGEGFTARYQNYYETQIIRLGLTYNF